jgi:hypothetical protein
VVVHLEDFDAGLAADLHGTEHKGSGQVTRVAGELEPDPCKGHWR